LIRSTESGRGGIVRRWKLVSAGSAKFWSSEEHGPLIPESWLAIIHPRRGGVPAPAVELRPGLDGRQRDSTPAEAAALALKYMPGHDDKLWMFVDDWVQGRGIPFAAAATASIGRGTSHAGTKAPLDAFLRMRRHLASTSDADYAAAVQALAGLRQDFASLFIVSYLVPTETAWADEACAAYWTQIHSDFERRLLVGIVSTPQQLASVGSGLLGGFGSDLAEIATLTEGAGTVAVPALVHLLGDGNQDSRDTEARRSACTALALLPCDEAFEALTARLGEKCVGSAVLEAMDRFPVRALRLLARASNGNGKSALLARTLLANHVRAHMQSVDGVLPQVPEREAKLISALAQETAARPEASLDTLPPLLVAPPWTRKRTERAEPAVVAGLEPPQLRTIEWAPGEQERWKSAALYDEPPVDWEKRAEQYASQGFDYEWFAGRFFAQAPERLAAPLLRRWKPNLRFWNLIEVLGPIVVRFGADAFDLALGAAREASPAGASPLLQPLVDLGTARLMADWFTRLKSGRAHAASWLTRHAETAALLLIPDAVGEPGAGRVAAENALRFLAPLTDVRAVAEHYGSEAVGAVDAVLEFDPLELYPRRMPAHPAWLEKTGLPQILLRGREYALPAASARHVLSMLAISKPGGPYAGLAVVRECADPLSLAEFAWALFGTWQISDMPAKDGWVLTALGWFGDDETVRRLAPLVRAWPGEGGHQRAVAGLDVLAELGTDAALVQLHQISQRVKFKALKVRAQEKIAEVARSLELTPDQLGDRLVPDFGLDADGGMWLDYGPRRFRVGFDEQLRPFVADEAGTRRKDLPPPNAKDDPELAPAARKRFSALKKDVRGVATDAIRRLEAAMVTGRTWSAAEFRELLVAHPLIWHLTRRLVWLSGTDDAADPARAFRVAEDRTLATLDDEEFRLPEDARVRVAHPLHLADDLAVWGELFADYEILQPFAQLGRPVYALTAQECEASRLTRFEGAQVPVGKVLGLVNRGWQRAEPMDAGIENHISREVGENLYLLIALEPGIAVGYVNEFGDQTLREVYLDTHRNGYWRQQGEDVPRLSTLDPVTASELLADLAQLQN
jgi:hypothetical protein